MKLLSTKKQEKGRVEILSPNSPFVYSEAYKTLRTNLSFASVSGQCKKIIVTSAMPNEGKSSVAINLAATLAESGAKVLIIDCDMRNPSIHRYLHIRGSVLKGLSVLLAGTAKLDDCVCTHPKLHFDFIIAGSIPPNPAELLGSANMQILMQEIGSIYDYIICDTPPVGVVTDAAVLSRCCDGVLLVVRQKFATRDQVNNAKQSLQAVKANIIGVVLNQYNIAEDVKEKSGRYGYYQSYDYKYGYDRK